MQPPKVADLSQVAGLRATPTPLSGEDLPSSDSVLPVSLAEMTLAEMTLAEMPLAEMTLAEMTLAEVTLAEVTLAEVTSVAKSLKRAAAPIGIFDSGVGGITVLRELFQQLPQESILYFGDTARLPYGSRSPQEIYEFTLEILEWMAQQQVKMVIMACNTCSALALEAVQGKFEFPVLGITLPGAQAAARQGQRVGVISTQATANSHAYRNAIQEVEPSTEVWEVGCPEFVPIIENNRILEPETREVVSRYLDPLVAQGIDTLIYGCTHYPHLAPVIRDLVPASVQLIDPAVHVAKAATQELDLLGLHSPRSPQPTRFFVSGDPEQFGTAAARMLGYAPLVERVKLTALRASPISDHAAPETFNIAC